MFRCLVSKISMFSLVVVVQCDVVECENYVEQCKLWIIGFVCSFVLCEILLECDFVYYGYCYVNDLEISVDEVGFVYNGVISYWVYVYRFWKEEG